MEFIKEPKNQTLSWVLCGYDSRMVFHRYNEITDSLNAGAPLTMRTARSIFKSLQKQESFNYGFPGILPSSVLKFKNDEKYIVWYTHETEKFLHFNTIADIKSGIYPIPPMIWKLQGNSLYVWATKGGVPQDESFKLYQAPFFNVSQAGSVCMGSAKWTTSSTDYNEIMKKAMAGFFGSIFTHSSVNDLLQFNYVKWCEMNFNCAKWIDFDILVDRNTTLKSIL